MNGWLTYEDFTAYCPDTPLTEAQFSQLASDAWFQIMEATHWRAGSSAAVAATAQLRQCQAQLIQLNSAAGRTWDGVISVSNHGYTESYASGADQKSYFQQRAAQIITRVLSAPETRWMLYVGGAYHPPRRR